MAKTNPTASTLGFEAELWRAADALRSNMDAAEYKHVVLGLLFLKYISDAFEEQHARLSAERAQGADPEDPDEYRAVHIFWVPPEARWSFLRDHARQPTIGKLVDDAMEAIERDNRSLKGVLPKDYGRPGLDKQRLGQLIDLVTNIRVGDRESRSKDVLGRVFEYFLSQFASAEGKKGGQFYTPTHVVRLLVEMLAPYKGRVYDPCCGSGGMFVSSEKFIAAHSGKIGDIAVYGQESNYTTWRLAKMNLAVRGVDANIAHGDSFHADAFPDLKADYVLANPPFNDSDWRGDLLRKDKRWQFGAPPAGNANFAWVQHFIHHLAPTGTAGFVLANGSMSSNQSNEGEIRKNIIEADLVDCVEHLGDNRIRHQDLPMVSDEDRERLSRYSLQPGDIVFSRVGSVDLRALVREEESGWLFSGRLLRVRPQRNLIDPEYLSWFFGLPSFRQHMRKIAVGATMPSLNTQLLSDLRIFFPSLPEQRAIAHILGTLDDKIELNRRMNATLEGMARALFKSWFVDFDPVRAKMEGHDTGLPPDLAALFPDRLVESDRGELPERWQLGTVGDLGEVICGKTPPTADQDNYGEGTPFVTIPDMHGRIFVTETARSLTEKGVVTQPTKTLPPYSVCVSCIATVGLVAMTSQVCQTNQQINSVVPRDSMSAIYCYFALRTLSNEIRLRGSGGSVVLNLNKGQFAALPVLVPPDELSVRFEDWARAPFDRILANERESHTLASLRDALLPKLLSGEVRLNRAEQITEVVS